MSLRQTLVGIVALLIGAGALNLGMGLQASLLGVRAVLEGFPTLLIGVIMSSYYAGFVLGSIYAPRVVAQVGHIRAFSAFASLASAAALCHAVFVDPYSWLVFRALTGFCFAALCLVTESWLNARADNLNRGTVLSVYFILILSCTAFGQVFLMMAPPAGYDLFVFVSVIISVALVPIALTSTPTPDLCAPDTMQLARLFSLSPVGVVGCFVSGLVAGAYWGLGAVFAKGQGLDADAIAVFMVLLVGGGVITQWPIGKMSDMMDRRIMIAVLAFAICALGGVVVAGIMPAGGFLYVSGAAMGGLVLPLYGVTLAHTNDHLDPEDFVPAGATLLLLYGAGAVLGPIFGTITMDLLGPDGLFLHLSLASAPLMVFTLFRMTRRPSVDMEEVADFVPMATTTVMAFELDPRSETEGEAEETVNPSETAGAV